MKTEKCVKCKKEYDLCGFDYEEVMAIEYFMKKTKAMDLCPDCIKDTSTKIRKLIEKEEIGYGVL